MAKRLNIDRIWWRNVQPGEFYNIERFHKIEGGGGSLYIEIPSSIVSATLDFLGSTRTLLDAVGVITIHAGVVGPLRLSSGPIEFQTKTGDRMRIANQNRQQPHSLRHPAWTSGNGFPTAPDHVKNTVEASQYFPPGGLRIYIAKTIEGGYYAGFTKGPRPTNMQPNDPMWGLYPQGRVVGGVIHAV